MHRHTPHHTTPAGDPEARSFQLLILETICGRRLGEGRMREKESGGRIKVNHDARAVIFTEEKRE
jgi:hypothetical protein